MFPIKSPLDLNATGNNVVNLQDALLLLLDRNLLAIPETDKARIIAEINKERLENVYGQNTARIVQLFQSQNQLETRSGVDLVTADKFNEILSGLGLISFEIAIDATQLTFNDFFIGDQLIDGSQEQTFLLQSRNYLLLISSKSLQVPIWITPQGRVDYVDADEGVVLGRGTNRITFLGHRVEFDTQSLSNPVLLLWAALSVTGKPFPLIQSGELSLIAGTYQIQLPVAEIADFSFQVDREGRFKYDAAYDGFLSGRDSTKLIMRGYTIQIDATRLSLDQVMIIPGVTQEHRNPKFVQAVTVLPGDYHYQFIGGGYADFTWRVTTQGRVEYDSRFSTFLASAGETGQTLTLKGLEVTIDALAVLNEIKLNLGGLISLRKKQLRLLPAALYYVTTNHSKYPDFTFQVNSEGKISYATTLDIAQGGVLSGLNTSTLTIGTEPEKRFTTPSITHDFNNFLRFARRYDEILYENAALQPGSLIDDVLLELLDQNDNPVAEQRFGEPNVVWEGTGAAIIARSIGSEKLEVRVRSWHDSGKNVRYRVTYLFSQTNIIPPPFTRRAVSVDKAKVIN